MGKSLRKIVMISMVIIVVLLIAIRIKRYAPSVANSLNRIRYTIEETGRFPESLNQWLASGFLKRIGNADGPVYYVQVRPFPEEEERWEIFGDFKKFTFAYGAKIENLELKGNQLYNKETNKKIYLIRGPDFWLYKSTYAKFSKELYEIMVSSADSTIQSDEMKINGILAQ